ncbi:unnamed protein product [Calypogeia fissa]
MMRGTFSDGGGVTNKPARIKVFAFIGSLVYIFLVCLSYQPGLVGGAILKGDLDYLLALKDSITCDSDNLLADWNEEDSNPCSWSGVQCDPDSLRVVALRLVGKRAHKASKVPSERADLEDGGAERVPCGLRGTLSPALGKLSELRLLSITFNRLSGELPKDIGDLKSLQILDLRSNLLTGQIPSELGKLSHLRVLNLDNNAFRGHIPTELSSCQKLRRLSLSGNVLSGSIPPSLGSLPGLQRLHLSYNNLVGSIPRDLFSGECRFIYLDLSGNRLSGSIPEEIGVCTDLRWLLLNFNNFVGSIPAEIGLLSRLKSLQVAGNLLSGYIPPQLHGCTMLEYLFLTSHHSWSSCNHRKEGNSFFGALPPGLALLPNLRILWAPDAGLSGLLPSDWGSCEKLEAVNLAQNTFAGELSTGLSNCERLFYLDLSSKQLTGSVPAELPGTCSRAFSLSANVRLGMIREIPNDIFGRSQSCNVDFHGGFWTNRVASQVALGRSSDDSKDHSILSGLRRRLLADGSSGSQRKLNSILVAAITSGCAIAIVLFVLGFLFQCSRFRKKRAPPPLPGRKVVVTFMNVNNSLTYENVVKATSNFSIDNLIGSGGFGATYKAEVKPGLLVAVKRLAIGRFQGVQQFDTEIRTLGRIRHPNLVTLIGYHASQDEMFLIYNFFSQGNLETLIHDHKEHMDWKIRHSIALRVAEALAFLHDDCVPRVLHRDIKPSNILLDDDFNAHLADFGLARLLGASETHATTDVAGTFGYVAPEYAMTCRVTDKADVYSYGVVLLELISGKKALDPSFCEYGDGFNIVSWACLLIRQGRAPEVFPTKLWEMGPEKHLLETLKLAVLCTVDQLQIRPSMKEVVDTLRKIRPGSSTA